MVKVEGSMPEEYFAADPGRCRGDRTIGAIIRTDERGAR